MNPVIVEDETVLGVVNHNIRGSVRHFWREEEEEGGRKTGGGRGIRKGEKQDNK